MRPIWSGSISFGLVNIPVALARAIVDLDAHFHQLHEPDGSRVEQHPFCSLEGREIDRAEVARGYELESGQVVVIEDDELEAVAPRRTHTITIESFCHLAEVDPVLRENAYLVAPVGDSEGVVRSYRLLTRTLVALGLAAVGRFVMRNRESLVLIYPKDERLIATTLYYGDELLAEEEVGVPAEPASQQALEHLVAVIEELTVGWSGEVLEDRYRARVRALIEQATETVQAPTPTTEAQPVPDLLTALRESMGAAERLEDLPRAELYERARQAGIKRRSRMSRRELIAALERRHDGG